MMGIKKRAVEALVSHLQQMNTNSTEPPKEMPKAGNTFALSLFILTLLVCGVGFILFDYTFQVVKILTIVEDLPSDYDLIPAYDSPQSEGEDGTPPTYHDGAPPATTADENAAVPKIAPGLYVGGEPDAHGKYITSSFRKAVRYLRQEGGFFGPWRGFVVNIVYCIVASIANGIFISMFPFPFGKYIAGVLVMVVVSPLNLVHTHVVMAPPTKETWFGRLSRLPYKAIVHTLPASLLVAVTGQLTYALPEIMANAFVPQRAFNEPPPAGNNPYQSMLTPLQCLAMYTVFISCHVLFFIPSMIILVRVQASVYNATEEAIIPFERIGPLSVVSAWKSYTWEGKKRLLRLYLKVIPLVWIVSFVVGTILFFEMRWAMGESSEVLDSILKTWLRNQRGMSD